MRINTRYSLLTIALLGAVVATIAVMIIRTQRQTLQAQSRVRLEALMEGATQMGRESLAVKDRLMLVSYLMFLRKAHPELAFAAVAYQGHTAKLGEDREGLVYLEADVSRVNAPIRYVVTAYPEQGTRQDDLQVSGQGVTLSVKGKMDVRVEEPADPEGMLIRLGFVKAVLDAKIAEALEPLMRKTLYIAGGFMVLGTLANIWLGMVLTAPIKELTAATALVARGRMDVSVKAKSKDEVGLLALRFNQMTSKLKEHMHFREDLLHMLTHELNTPLGGLKAYIELWKERRYLTEGERKEGLEVMNEAVLRMESSLGSALKLFRQEHKAPEAGSMEPVWVHEVIREVIQLFAPVALSKKIRLTVANPEAMGTLYGSEESVRLIVSNLVSNALKYTPEGGSVSVGLADSAEETHLWVKDTGYGIKQADIPHLFTKFYRSEEERSKAQRIPGTGLGLALVHRTVASLGGRIWVESEERRGSTFRVTVPKRRKS